MFKNRRALYAFLVVDFFLAIVIIGTFYLRTTAPADLSDLGASVLPQQQVLGHFELTDHRGNAFNNDDLTGSWNLLFFGFTSCPDVCPLTMTALKLFYQELEKADAHSDTRVVMVSVDPQRDTVEAMADYVKRYHEDFVGLTGASTEISNLASQLYIAISHPQTHDTAHEADDYIVEHSGYIAIVNPEGRFHSVLRAPHTLSSLSRAYTAIREI